MTHDRRQTRISSFKLVGCVLRTMPWADGQELVRGTHPAHFSLGTSHLESSTVCHPSGLVLFALLPLFLLGGCEGRALEEARQEARDAQVTIEKLKYNLNEANREISRLKAELGAVRQTRDEVQNRIVRLIEERDQASALAQQNQEMVVQLTTRASGQATATMALEKQIAELKALVEDQQKLIEQLQKGAPAEPPTEVGAEPLPAVEPNQTP